MNVAEVVNCLPITSGQFVLFSGVIKTLPVIKALISQHPFHLGVALGYN